MLSNIKTEIKNDLEKNGSIDKEKYIEKYQDVFSIQGLEALFTIMEHSHANGR